MPFIPLLIAGGAGLLGGMFLGGQADDAIEGGKNEISLFKIAMYAVLAYVVWRIIKKVR